MRNTEKNAPSTLSIFWALCALIFLLATTAYAASGNSNAHTKPKIPVPSDFAYAYTLTGAQNADGDVENFTALEEGRIYRSHIKPEIFRHVMTSITRDLVIFDATGTVIPFLIREAAVPFGNETIDHGAVAEGPLSSIALYALPKTKTTESGIRSPAPDVIVRTDANGQIVEIRGANDGAGGQEQSGRYLADLARVNDAFPGQPIGYRLEIPIPGSGDVATTVDVYASDNLRDWKQVAHGEPLVRLNHMEENVQSGPFEITGTYRYLTLEIESGIRHDRILVVPLAKPQRRISLADASTFQGRTGADGAFYYDTQGIFPASMVDFALRTPGVYVASISSRHSPEDQWVLRNRVLLSLIRNESNESRNAPLRINETNHRYWKLALESGPAGEPARMAEAPEMRFSWQPQEVVFVTQGHPPYLLAVGWQSEGIMPRLQRSDLVQEALRVASGHTIPEAQIGAPLSQDQIPAQQWQPDSADGEKWQQYLVWAILVGGALLLSWIAWSLMRKNTKNG